MKATADQQRCTARGLPACVSLTEASLAYPISKEKMSATGIPQKYLSKWLTTLSPKDYLYACTFEGCDCIFKQLAGVYNHLRRLHLGVAVGCYYCSGCWWTLKGWSDHHAREYPLSNAYPSGADLESLLVKKAQAGVAAESKAMPPLLWLTTSPKMSPYPPLPLRRIKRTVLSLLLLPFRQRSQCPPLLRRLPHPHREIFRELIHVFLLLPLVLVAIRRYCLIVPPVIKFTSFRFVILFYPSLWLIKPLFLLSCSFSINH